VANKQDRRDSKALRITDLRYESRVANALGAGTGKKKKPPEGGFSMA